MSKALTLPLFAYADITIEATPEARTVSDRGAWEIAHHQRAWIASYQRAITQLAGQQTTDRIAQEWQTQDGDRALGTEMLFWLRQLGQVQACRAATLGGA